jgi:molybdopterin adenylyltransferase
MKAGILTLSDKGSRGDREDLSGAVIREMLEQAGIIVTAYEVIPDEADLISSKLKEWSDSKKLSLIITTGGTGLSPRDVTPEATLAVIEKRVPGMEEAMRMESLKKTPNAMISRAVAGIRGRTLIVNLPGSPRAVRENLDVILPALPHALSKLGGDIADCGS